MLNQLDDLQARIKPIAFVVAVAKKYGDDRASQLAALMTYYGFLSLFPLLLAIGVVLSIVLNGNPQLQSDIWDALVDNAQVRQDLETAITRVSSAGWWVLLVSLGAFLFSGLGGISAAYLAFNDIWAVPVRDRYGFVPRYGRLISVLFLTVGGVVLAIFINLRILPDTDNLFARILSITVTGLIAIGLFFGATWLLIRRKPSVIGLLSASIVGGIAVTVLAFSTSFLISTLIQRAGPVYGGFASIVGLLAFLFVAMQAIIIASEAGSVWAWHLWPRGLDLQRAREGDIRAYELYAQTGLLAPGEQVFVRWKGAKA